MRLAIGFQAVVLVTLALAACSERAAVTAPVTASRQADDDEGDDHENRGGTRTYDVTIVNLTTGQPFSPGVLVTHSGRHALFRVGRPASQGLRLIAEDGDERTALEELAGRPGVSHVVDVNVPTGRGGGSLPTSRTFRIDARPQARRLSLAVMLICTNDGFTGLSGVKLPQGFAPQTHYAAGYDAGTEANDERSTSIVDPCFAIGPAPGAADGNARTPTNGVVRHHRGIKGDADLDRNAHGWRDPVAHVTIQRVQ